MGIRRQKLIQKENKLKQCLKPVLPIKYQKKKAQINLKRKKVKFCGKILEVLLDIKQQVGSSNFSPMMAQLYITRATQRIIEIWAWWTRYINLLMWSFLSVIRHKALQRMLQPNAIPILRIAILLFLCSWATITSSKMRIKIPQIAGNFLGKFHPYQLTTPK